MARGDANGVASLLVNRLRRQGGSSCRGGERGLVGFHLPPDRRRPVFQYQVGPRSGRGLLLRVSGQGRRGRLQPDGRVVRVS